MLRVYLSSKDHETRPETYIFQDDLIYLWDSTNDTCGGSYPKGAVAKGWPKKIKDVFPIPKHLWHTPVDTVFQNYFTGKVTFFYGKYFYAFEWQNTTETWTTKGPKPTRQYYRNICNVYMCTEYLPDRNCRHWGLKKEDVENELPPPISNGEIKLQSKTTSSSTVSTCPLQVANIPKQKRSTT